MHPLGDTLLMFQRMACKISAISISDSTRIYAQHLATSLYRGRLPVVECFSAHSQNHQHIPSYHLRYTLHKRPNCNRQKYLATKSFLSLKNQLILSPLLAICSDGVGSPVIIWRSSVPLAFLANCHHYNRKKSSLQINRGRVLFCSVLKSCEIIDFF